MKRPILTLPKRSKATGRDSDPRRTLPLQGAAWQRLRASVLAEEPLCRHCHARGLLTEATDVDHRDGNPGNNEQDNLQPLCHSCHSIKTARDHGKQVSMGHDSDGLPLDPSHPWAKVCRLLQPREPEIAGEFAPQTALSPEL
ncbi:HNH endonuclease signature motif containing protein [Pulveribacter suum]|uniref:HNH endonuclease signature motif containing protein n=1 Tax=Pulveribacter suum TaxID=2116657 RepID=UPI001875B909|nr:HNH endonuclease signature motif containing protein [Pulveribacter suum]